MDISWMWEAVRLAHIFHQGSSLQSGIALANSS